MFDARLFRGLRGIAAITIGTTLGLLFLPVAVLCAMTNMTAVSESSDAAQLYTGTSDTTNAYDFGYCTFWVAERRIQTGHPIPGHWGDAHEWDTNARSAGYRVDEKPQVGAIWQSDMAPLGHVAFVEEVYNDGRIKVSEMNWQGWDIMDQRILSVAQAQHSTYIH